MGAFNSTVSSNQSKDKLCEVKAGCVNGTDEIDKHSSCMESGSHSTLDNNNISISVDSEYVDLKELSKKESCCLNKDGLYSLFASVERCGTINYSYFMKACCYATLTRDSKFTNCFKCRGLFPFNIGVIDIVRLSNSNEVYDFKENNYRVFSIVDSTGNNKFVKFAKVPYIGSVYH